MLRSHLLLLLVLISLTVAGIAKDKPNAAELFARARAVSSFSEAGAAPNHIVVTFRALHLTSGELDGHFEEYWKDTHLFRTEGSLGQFHVVLIRTPQALWEPRDLVFQPRPLRSLRSLIFGFQLAFVANENKFRKVRNEKINGRDVFCTEQRTSFTRSKYCFDVPTGVLLRSEEHYGAGEGFDRVTIQEYSDYTSFGSKLYPRKLVLQNNGKPWIEATIDSVETWTPNDDLLQPPQDYVAHPVCDQGPVKAPQATYTPDPEYPKGKTGYRSVTFHILVSDQGKVAARQVEISGGREFDEVADRALQQWRFQPARCEGRPMPVEVDVQINFRK